MSQSYKYYVPSLPDNAIFKVFKNAYEILSSSGQIQPTNALNATFSSLLSYQDININSDAQWSSEDAKHLSEVAGTVISSARITFPNFSLKYQRTPGSPDLNGDLGLITISLSQQLTVKAEILKKVHELFSKKLLVGKVGESQNLIESHSKILVEMQSLAVKVQEDNANYRRQLEDEFLNKFKNNEKEKNKEIENIKKEYASKEESLNERIKKLDDRQNTHVRREIRSEINNKIQNRISNLDSSATVSDLRWPIHTAYIVLILLSGYGLIHFSREFGVLIENEKLSANYTAIILALLKPLTFTGVFTSTFIFYIKWLNHWFEKKSAEEVMLRKYQLDIERSSWIIETVLESVTQVKHQLPMDLMQSFTKNLFQVDEKEKKGLEHPADQLASALLGSAANVRLKLGENFVGLDRRSIKNMTTEATGD